MESSLLSFKFYGVFARILILICFVPFLHAADRSKDLAPRYRHWLTEEVNYIIDSSEKKQFLALTTDSQRESFIEAFWKIRNPDPGSDSNSYRDEHYRRLAYVNEHFGSVRSQDGWRTDQGRIYIVLGPPKQIVTYPAARNVRPMQIWFYESPSRALPPYFNLVFYKQSIGEPYSLYSPNRDGPAKLVATLEAMNDQKKSLEILRKSLGNEVATTALTLIPGESVDLDDYQPNMSSDLLLSAIEGLPDNPLTQEQLDLNRAREHVTMSLVLGEQDATISYDVFRDEQGRQTLSYLIRSAVPDQRIVGNNDDGSHLYDITLRTTVTTPDKKPVYVQEDHLTGNLTDAQAQVARKKRFAAEARIPLSPGNFVIEATLTNNLTHTATRQHMSVTVPEPAKQSIALSPLLAYAGTAVTDPQGRLPFSIAGLRFPPRGAQNVYLRQGERLPLVFQLWLDPPATAAPAPEKIHLHYVFGSIAASHSDASEEDEDVDGANRDHAGNLVTGRNLDTSGLMPGSYKVVLSASREGEQKTAYATINLHVAASSDYVDTWTAFGPPDTGGESTDDFKRGLAAEAEGANALAQAAYERALAEGPADMRPLDKLADLLSRNGTTDQLAALSRQPVLAKTAATPSTLLEIAGALDKNGNPKAAVQMLEAQLLVQPPNVELYNALAEACQASGNTTRANELRTLAANLKK
jgi:GWxTD domain-containing protein